MRGAELVAMGAVIATTGCSVSPVDLSGRECPCTAGWYCDESVGVCMRGFRRTDAGMFDAAAGTDAGPSLDASTRDAGVTPDDAGVSTDAATDGGADAGTMPGFETQYIEAESGTLVAPFTVVSEPGASNDQIVVDDGASTGDPSGGSATYTFTVGRSDTFYLWGRARATSGGTDSFHVSVDGAAMVNYNTAPDGTYSVWHWTPVGNTTVPRYEFPLTAGTHELVLISREAQSQIDVLAVTNDPDFVP